jgi:hypothetical protein
VIGVGPPVGLFPLTFPSQPTVVIASGAIASAATMERNEAFIATTFRTSTRLADRHSRADRTGDR